jgi:two-component system phosphate regulon response regulator OmpR
VTIAATLARTPAHPADDAPHLLLVDDDRRIRDLLSRFLRAEGYRVTTAESASDARAKLLGLHFDLLIDRKSTRLNSSHTSKSRMPSSA